MADDLQVARLRRRVAKLEVNLADLKVRWIRDQAWADEVAIIMDRRRIDYPPRPKFPHD